MGKDIVAAPDGAERTQTGGIEGFERDEIGIDRLAAFHVHNSSENAFLHAVADVGRGPAELPGAGAVESQRDRGHVQRDVERGRALKRSRQRRGIMAVAIRIGENEIARRNIDGAQPPAKPPALARGASM